MKKRAVTALLLCSCLTLCACGAAEKPKTETAVTEVVQQADESAVEETVQQVQPSPEQPEAAEEEQPPEEEEIILGGLVLSPDTEVLTPPGNVDADEIREAMEKLEKLRSVRLEDSSLSAEEISGLISDYPETDFSFSVSFCDTVLDENTQTLELSSAQSEELYGAAGLLKNVELIHIYDEADAEPQLELIRGLQETFPHIDFDYSFGLFGKEINTLDTRVEFAGTKIGDEGIPTLREALACLTKCEYFLLDNCGISNAALDELSTEFPERNIVWRIFFGYFNFLTDVRVIHLTDLVTDENVYQIGYCKNLEYLDIGHNSITDVSFISRLEHLKLCILSFNKLESLEPFRNLRELEMLELYYCLNVKDISPIAQLPKLRLFNITWTAADDISCVTDMKQLTRFSCYHTLSVPEEQKQAVLEALPECWITFEDPDFDYKWVGWRFDDVGVKAQWYDDMTKIFVYTEPVYFGDVPEGFEDCHFSWS